MLNAVIQKNERENMLMFSLGPVTMFPHTLEIAAQQVPYFRTPEFSKVMLESEVLLKDAIGASEESKVVFLTASGTGAMEATVMNCFTTQDRLLVVNGGIFGKRFSQICDIHHIPYDEIILGFGEVLSNSHFNAVKGNTYAALLINIDETSTGQLYDIDMVSDFCKSKGMYLIVDAISSFLADPYAMEKHQIDATILSTQKGLAVAPGMSIVTISKRLFEERVEKIDSETMYFDFKDHIENQKRGQTPFTPAVGVALQIHDMLVHLSCETIAARLAQVDKIVKDFRCKVSALPIEIPTYPLSNALTPLIFPRNNAVTVYEKLKTQYNIILTPCGGELKDKLVRVGHIGNHSLEENDMLAAALKEVLDLEGD